MDILREKLRCTAMGARLYCGGGGGGDGGAAERKAAEDARQAAAIARLNQTFGVGTAPAPDRSAYTKKVTRNATGQVVEPARFREITFGKAGDSMGSLDPSQNLVEVDEFDQSGFDAATGAYERSKTAGAEREALYGKFASDSKALQLDELTKDRGLAERDVGFDLARRGLFGGSRQIDTGREIEDQFNRGVHTADNNAQGVANTARINDEGTRVSLMNSIRSGMGEADAASSAFAAMQNNARDAETQARNQSVGGFFDAIRGAATSGQQAAAYEREFKKYQTGGGSAGGSYGGSVRPAG